MYMYLFDYNVHTCTVYNVNKEDVNTPTPPPNFFLSQTPLWNFDGSAADFVPQYLR